MRHFIFLSLLLILSIYGNLATAKDKESAYLEHKKHLTGPYSNGISVTRDCLKCHKDKAQEILTSAHWLWKGPNLYVQGAEKRTDLGKRNLLNNF